MIGGGNMDKLDKCYYRHITTLAKMKNLRKECKRECFLNQKEQS